MDAVYGRGENVIASVVGRDRSQCKAVVGDLSRGGVGDGVGENRSPPGPPDVKSEDLGVMRESKKREFDPNRRRQT